MIIARLDGGMGNQLFQYAAGKCLAQKLNAELKLDVSLYTPGNKRRYTLQHFGIEETFCTDSEKKLLNRKEYIRQKLKLTGIRLKPYWYTEQKPGYDEYFQQLTDNVYLEGFWQSEKYFKPIENSIRKQFTVKDPPSDLNRKHLDEIIAVNAIAIHVRRGDYVNDKETAAVHGVCDISYYKAAIDRLSSEISEPRFYIFSDDIAWAKENLSTYPYPSTYIDNNATADYEDMRLMYSCKHHIIANSSFSWWGAWLNEYPGKKVIAPKKWFLALTNDDITPEGWLTL